MTIFTASNVSRKNILPHKILKQVPDSITHTFKWKQPRISKINSANQKVSFWNHSI